MYSQMAEVLNCMAAVPSNTSDNAIKKEIPVIAGDERWLSVIYFVILSHLFFFPTREQLLVQR